MTEKSKVILKVYVKPIIQKKYLKIIRVPSVPILHFCCKLFAIIVFARKFLLLEKYEKGCRFGSILEKSLILLSDSIGKNITLPICNAFMIGRMFTPI